MNKLLISVESCASPLSTRRVSRGLRCMKKIKLTQGKYALVDDEDYEWLSQWKWHYNKGYAVRGVFNGKNMSKIRLHREVAKMKPGEITDHINRNKLDNRKSNLRSVTVSQNRRNVKSKGYSWDKKMNKWKAQIQIHRKKIYLGSFTSERSARKAYITAYNKCF